MSNRSGRSEGEVIVIDWGTSSVRAHLIDKEGRVVGIRRSDKGVGKVSSTAELLSALKLLIQGWECSKVVMCGMIGSRNGLVEVPYVSSPVDALKLAKGCVRLEIGHSSEEREEGCGKRHVWIVPGVACKASEAPSSAEDVMRGEETQIIGCMQTLQENERKGSRLVVLPGTHNKWALMCDGKLERFWTMMTGELFEVIRKYTILSKLMLNDSKDCQTSFLRGVSYAKDGDGGILNSLFSVRTLALFGKLGEDQAESYLSGLLQGTDIKNGLKLPGVSKAIKTNRPVILVGSTRLCNQYASAFKLFGIESEQLGDTSIEGLQLVSEALAGLQLVPLSHPQRHGSGKGEKASRRTQLLNQFQNLMETLPIVAILRGIEPSQVVEVGQVLVDQGIKIIEVPLNSPRPYDSIRLLAKALEGRAIVGAGTVLSSEEVEKVAEAGGVLIVSPNADERVIQRTRQKGLISVPGFQTPSEAFKGLEAGADALKLFPSHQSAAPMLKACMSVFPKGTKVVAVGGIGDRDSIKLFWKVGARGFGIGGALYKAGRSTLEVKKNAKELVSAMEYVLKEEA